MNYLSSISLRVLRKAYLLLNLSESNQGRNWRMFSNKQYSNKLIYEKLITEQPCMIGRFGAFELNCLVNYMGVKDEKNKSYKKFLTGKSPSWWWDETLLNHMHMNAGFFPLSSSNIERFCELMIEDITQLDVLGSWLKEESFFHQELEKAKKVVLEDLEPFFCTNPWTRALKGKKVLIVHPFAETIEQQYLKREVLFDDNLLPEFELKTIKAVQTVAGTKSGFNDWFEALEFMKKRIDETDYDICIVGCGAYGFPLAAHVKRMGKKSIHMAGATQLLFGIKGRRWEEFIVWPYSNLFNEHWVRPGEQETPSNAAVIEGACYW